MPIRKAEPVHAASKVVVQNTPNPFQNCYGPKLEGPIDLAKQFVTSDRNWAVDASFLTLVSLSSKDLKAILVVNPINNAMEAGFETQDGFRMTIVATSGFATILFDKAAEVYDKSGFVDNCHLVAFLRKDGEIQVDLLGEGMRKQIKSLMGSLVQACPTVGNPATAALLFDLVFV